MIHLMVDTKRMMDLPKNKVVWNGVEREIRNGVERVIRNAVKRVKENESYFIWYVRFSVGIEWRWEYVFFFLLLP